MRPVLAFVFLIVAGCSDTPNAEDTGLLDAAGDVALDAVDDAREDATEDAGDGAREVSERIRAADRAFVAEFARVAETATASGVPDNREGLLGRNREWGDLYAARFQLGAGWAFRVALAAGDDTRARAAFSAIAAGAATITDSGEVPARIPDEVAMGAEPSAADIASGAAFFLGDACVAMLAAGAGDGLDDAARESVRDALGRAGRWLTTQQEMLMRIDARAPNRLLHNAVAFASCGALSGDDDVVAAARPFASAAAALYNEDDGTFIEGGGFDTNYQAVAVVQLIELRWFDEGPDVVSDALSWMVARTSANGVVDSTENRRSCGGCETFLPGDPPKQLGPVVWLRALAYGGEDDAIAAADRFIGWIARERETSCYVRDGERLVALDLETACE